MKIFTLWHSDVIAEPYAACVEKSRNVYSQLEVIKCEEPENDTHPGIVTDKLRMQILTDTEGDVLYLDADVVAHKYLPRFDKPAFYNYAGGSLDICVIFKPDGSEEFFGELAELANCIQMQQHINRHMDKCEIIYGYPDYKYFEHMAFSMRKGLKPN